MEVHDFSNGLRRPYTGCSRRYPVFYRSFVAREKGQGTAETNESTLDRDILFVAKNEQGKVTPAIIALNTNISLEDASKALENMVKQGYATMEVRDSGTVEYVFPEFIP